MYSLYLMKVFQEDSDLWINILWVYYCHTESLTQPLPIG